MINFAHGAAGGVRFARTAKASAEFEQWPLHKDVESQAQRHRDAACDHHQQQGRNGWYQARDGRTAVQSWTVNVMRRQALASADDAE